MAVRGVGETRAATTRLDYLGDAGVVRGRSRIVEMHDGVVTLDATIFSPPAPYRAGDVGTIGTRRVLAAWMSDGGPRYRLTSTRSLCPGHVLEVRVDRRRRRGLAVHETLSHLLRRYALDVYGADVQSMAVGPGHVTVGLPGGDPDLAAVRRYLEAAIAADEPRCRVPGGEDGVAAVGFGSGPMLDDAQGLHVASTGAAGPVAVLMDRTVPGGVRVVACDVGT